MEKPVVDVASMEALEQLLEDWIAGKSGGDEIMQSTSPKPGFGADRPAPANTGRSGSIRRSATGQSGAMHKVAGRSPAGRRRETSKAGRSG